MRMAPENLGHAKPEYGPEYNREQLALKRNIEYDRMLQAESDYIQQLRREGREGDYSPSLEQHTISMKALKVPYKSPILAAQTPEQTAAAKESIRSWHTKIHGCKPEERRGLIQQLIAETPFLSVMRQSRREMATSFWEEQYIATLHYHGLVPGVEGYGIFCHNQNEEIMEEFVEISGVTMFPQAFCGGQSIGDWQAVVGIHNSGAMVPMMQSVGFRSKMKGAYMYPNMALVKH